ncbi:hypothetical protein MtrunA17_Chr3g0108621 [Medicago truncatula]|uniref:Uncharacterized protein n=1 Tax=Medicago truncatula TaxID=3880 RepID=A0A396IRJ5_MEDTR|nr:hypothetical protein MtrunA17_Chr3g0108621 [Medicago truncatula]
MEGFIIISPKVLNTLLGSGSCWVLISFIGRHVLYMALAIVYEFEPQTLHILCIVRTN